PALTDQPQAQSARSASAAQPGGVPTRSIEQLDRRPKIQTAPRRRRPRQAVAGPARQPPSAGASLGCRRLAAAAALTESNTRLLASNRPCRMRHRLPGHRVGPPTAVTPAISGPGAPAEASVLKQRRSDGHDNNGDDKPAESCRGDTRTQLCSQPRQPRRCQKLQQVASRLLSLRPFDQVTSPRPAAEQLLPNRVESGSPAPLFQQSAAQQQRDAQPLSARSRRRWSRHRQRQRPSRRPRSGCGHDSGGVQLLRDRAFESLEPEAAAAISGG
uniref:Serine/arginine repetitive matrix protein 2 n=1 Tax=Macrostomum lignano TaxID=282301 RepID=A0A1I8F9M3_9PLAT